jgi:hypothetical protein
LSDEPEPAGTTGPDQTPRPYRGRRDNYRALSTYWARRAYAAEEEVERLRRCLAVAAPPEGGPVVAIPVTTLNKLTVELEAQTILAGGNEATMQQWEGEAARLRVKAERMQELYRTEFVKHTETMTRNTGLTYEIDHLKYLLAWIRTGLPALSEPAQRIDAVVEDWRERAMK